MSFGISRLWGSLLLRGPNLLGHITSRQCFRQSAPLRESRVAIRDGPQKNEKGADVALCFYMTAGLTQA